MAKSRSAQISDLGDEFLPRTPKKDGHSSNKIMKNKNQSSRVLNGSDADSASEGDVDDDDDEGDDDFSPNGKERDGSAPLGVSVVSKETKRRSAGPIARGDKPIPMKRDNSFATSIASETTAGGAEDDEDGETLTQFTDDVSMSDGADYQAKLNELEATGWQPSTELDSAFDDDDYGELDQMSEDEHDDKHGIKELEMKELEREFEKEHGQNANLGAEETDNAEEQSPRRLSLGSLGSGQSEFDLNFNQDSDPWGGLTPLDEPYMALWNSAEANIWRMPAMDRSRENSLQSNDNQKKVRFEDEVAASSSSSSDDSEDEDDAFPDLFLAQDQLDPLYMHAIDADLDDEFHMDDGSDAGSFWDFDADERIALAADEDGVSSDSSGSVDSDDEGDTTDDEMPPVVLAKVAQRPPATPARTSGSAFKTPITGKRTLPASGKKATPKDLNTPKGPRAGTFNLDPTRATIKVTPTGKIETLPPRQPAAKDRAFWERVARSRLNSRNSSPHPSHRLDDENGNPIIPFFTAQSTLGTMFDGNLEYLRNDSQAVVPEASPFVPAASGLALSSYDANEYDSDMDFADAADFEDLIDLGDSDTEEEDEETAAESDSVLSPGTTTSFAHFPGPLSPTRPTTAGSDLLAHLDRNRSAVGSFRRNQHNARHLGSLPSHPGLRASASEKNALQTGRRAAANLPMTPARKRIGKTVGARSSPISSPMIKQSPKSRERRNSTLKGTLNARR